MGTPFDPEVHSIITGANSKPVPQFYSEEANAGAGGFVVDEGNRQNYIYTGSLWVPQSGDANGNQKIAADAAKIADLKSLLDAFNAEDFASETKLEAVRLLLALLEGKDYATAVKQDLAKTVLDTIAAKDFATQTTLAAILAKLIAAPATEAKQDDVKAVLDTLGTEATLAAIKNWVDGTDSTSAPKVQLNGSIVQDDDLINTDTIITAGANSVIGDITTLKGKEISLALRQTTTRKYRVVGLFYPKSSDSFVDELDIIDNSASGSQVDSGIVKSRTNRFKARIYNEDTSDMTVEHLTLMEVN